MMTSKEKQDPESDSPRPVFIYGTLCAKPLLAWALTGECTSVDTVEPLLQPAKASGFARYGVNNCDFPAAVECKGCETFGYLVTCSTMSQRKKLDDFEGEAYRPTLVRVELLNGNEEPTGETAMADMYLWNGSLGDLTQEPWDFEAFKKDRLEDWLDLFDGMELVG